MGCADSAQERARLCSGRFSRERGTGGFGKPLVSGLVRVGLGGAVGSGRQFVSWIHDTDFVRAIEFLVSHGNIEGIVNLAAPNPLPNAEFMRELRHAAGIPVGLPAPEWLLAIGTFLLRTEPELVLKSRRVVPIRLLASGFRFEFPDWKPAAEDLVRRWRARRQ